MADNDLKLDLSGSNLVLQGTPEIQAEWKKKIKNRVDYLLGDQSERKSIYKVRQDFNNGDHTKYTNIIGLKNKEKEGHAASVINYAGKTAVKIAYSLANNPPRMDYPIDEIYAPLDPDYAIEEARTQATESFVNTVLKRNKFWKRGYRRSCFNQVIVGDFAIKVFPEKAEYGWEIKIIGHEKMENLLVGWRGDDTREFDYVIAEELRSIQSIEDDWGIKVPEKYVELAESEDAKTGESSHNNNNQWGTKKGGSGRAILPSGKNKVPSLMVREYDDSNAYAITIGGELVQLVMKDDINFPKMKLWELGENIPAPGNNWSIADIDYLIDPNIELNEASNEERDYIRVGANQKFVAYNMDDFDPESIKTGSGGVIFVSSSDGSAKFEALNTNVNTFPTDSYLTRMKKHIHDLGIPEVAYGSAGSDSGRSKALDYQSFVDLIDFKQDTWEVVLESVAEKIQRLGHFYLKLDFLTDAKTNQFKYRCPDFDWDDIVPVTQGDKVVTILNKVQMGLPFELAVKELGYKDVKGVLDMMRKEAQDPDLMTYRAKAFQLTPGLQQAQTQAMINQQQTGQMPGADVNAQNAGPQLTTDQNEGRDSSLPMATRGGTTSFSSPMGFVDQTRQNLEAAGQ